MARTNDPIGRNTGSVDQCGRPAAGLDINNPPKTWEEFETWAAAMTDKANGVYGTALLAKKDETGTFLFLPWVLQNGGNIDKLDSPESIEALAFWTDLVNKGYAPKSAVTDGFAEIYTQFTTGKAGMMISGTWNVNSIPNDAPDLNWMVAELPYTKQAFFAVSGENWAMMANGQQPDGAWAYLEFVTNVDYGTKLTDCMVTSPAARMSLPKLPKNRQTIPPCRSF
jgi:multiple sugar transport system substrate-binding protein